MAQLINPGMADAAAHALHETVGRFAEVSPGMYTRQGAAGTRLTFTGLPMPNLNVVDFGNEPDLAEVEAFAKELATKGVPWGIELRRDAGPGVLDLAARLGLTGTETLPLLVWDADEASLPDSVPAGATVRILTGAEHELFSDALAAGFEMPKEIADVFSHPAVLDAPDAVAFVLEVDGEAVATGMNIVAGEWVGMYCGSVPPQYRRHGYYRALVAARLRHAIASGARYSFTQNTPMSQPLYESLGYQVAETWTYLTSEES